MSTCVQLCDGREPVTDLRYSSEIQQTWCSSGTIYTKDRDMKGRAGSHTLAYTLLGCEDASILGRGDECAPGLGNWQCHLNLTILPSSANWKTRVVASTEFVISRACRYS